MTFPNICILGEGPISFFPDGASSTGYGTAAQGIPPAEASSLGCQHVSMHDAKASFGRTGGVLTTILGMLLPITTPDTVGRSKLPTRPAPWTKHVRSLGAPVSEQFDSFSSSGRPRIPRSFTTLTGLVSGVALSTRS